MVNNSDEQQFDVRIAALTEWPSVSKGNYPSWDNGYRNTWGTAAEERLRLAVDWMKSRMPCTCGECCADLRKMIAVCEVPSDE